MAFWVGEILGLFGIAGCLFLLLVLVLKRRESPDDIPERGDKPWREDREA